MESGAVTTSRSESTCPDQPGTYRFRYFAYADARLRSLIPVEERASPPITITR